jgi:hypothetical protein
MSITSAGSNSAYKASTGFARRLLTTAAAVIGLAPVAFVQASGAQAADPQTFFVLNNQTDPMFNQLLGINKGNVIVGYYGDGMAIANNGYVLVPPNHYSTDFTLLNFTLPNGGNTASQVQAIGINENSALAGATPFPDIVGFYTDANTGFTHGFVDSIGVQSTIDDPMGLKGIKMPVQNLLGINNSLRAAGFWTDNNGNENGFVAEINTQTTPVAARFTELTPAKVNTDLGLPPTTVVATQASDINNNSGNNLVCGFWTDANKNNHGFEVFFNTAAHSFNTVQPITAKIPNVNVLSLSPLGCNDAAAVVGTYIAIDNNNNQTVHGFVFDGTTWHNYDAPGSSQTAAFNVAGTIINGINNNGTIVGFFSDGENVNGFVDFAPVP